MADGHCTNCGSDSVICVNEDKQAEKVCRTFQCQNCPAKFSRIEQITQACAPQSDFNSGADKGESLGRQGVSLKKRLPRRSLANFPLRTVAAALLTFVLLLALGVFCYLSITNTSFVRSVWKLNLDRWVNLIGDGLYLIYFLILFVYFIIEAVDYFKNK